MDKVQVLIQAFLQIPERYCMMKKYAQQRVGGN